MPTNTGYRRDETEVEEFPQSIEGPDVARNIKPDRHTTLTSNLAIKMVVGTICIMMLSVTFRAVWFGEEAALTYVTTMTQVIGGFVCGYLFKPKEDGDSNG
jgi:hypothetical protein